jgi:hypothetical protein
MSKVIKGECFDKTLLQKEDLDFFFISSKDNIIIKINTDIKCYNRKEIIKTAIKLEYYGKELYILNGNFGRDNFILLDHNSFNHLKYRNYSVYEVIPTNKTYAKYGVLYELKYFKRADYFM